MRRFAFSLLLLLMLLFAGCKVRQSVDSNDAATSVKTSYPPNSSTEDCYLCGGGIENMIPSYWGQNNIALISLNTFEIKPLEINRYDMANVQTTNGTYKDVLFQCDLTDMSVKQIWITPNKDEVGEWERTGVSVSQWYVTNGYIYFYLSGGDMWRTELSSGKAEKLADTHKQTQYGSAVFSDDYMCLLNDIPVYFYGSKEPEPGSMFRYYGDTIFVYGLDGTFIKEISLKGLYDDPEDTLWPSRQSGVLS